MTTPLSPNYSDVQESARDGIADAGTAVQITRPGGGAFDPVTDVTTAGTPLTQTASAVADFLKRSGEEGDFDPGTTTKRDFRILWIAALGLTFDPQPGDVVIWPASSGVKWSMIGAKPVDPDGAPILWRCIIER